MNTPPDWKNCKSIFLLAQKAIHDARNEYFNFTLSNMLKNDPQKFWEVVSSKNNHPVATLRGYDGVVLPVGECAEAFNNNFAEVFTDNYL